MHAPADVLPAPRDSSPHPVSSAQGGQGPQAAVCRFIGPGGRAERDAFYRRLGRAAPAELPSALVTADVVLESGDAGAWLSLMMTPLQADCSLSRHGCPAQMCCRQTYSPCRCSQSMTGGFQLVMGNHRECM